MLQGLGLVLVTNRLSTVTKISELGLPESFYKKDSIRVILESWKELAAGPRSPSRWFSNQYQLIPPTKYHAICSHHLVEAAKYVVHLHRRALWENKAPSVWKSRVSCNGFETMQPPVTAIPQSFRQKEKTVWNSKCFQENTGHLDRKAVRIEEGYCLEHNQNLSRWNSPAEA